MNLTGRSELTPAERLVLRYVSNGFSDEEIAADLRLSVHTVKDQVKAARRRLGARNRAHAVAEGYRRGILTERETPPASWTRCD